MPVYLNEDVLQSEDCPGLIDTHCHLDLEPLISRIDEALSEARQAGISEFVVPGVHPGGWERMQNLAQNQSGVFAAFGIHPMHGNLATDEVLARLADTAGNGIAVGETGLDPLYDVAMDLQEQVFRKQIRIAVEQGLPLLLHCRRAFLRTLTVLRQEGAQRVGGIMHAFSGSSEMAREFIRLGFAISISGMVTREAAVRLPRLVQKLPLEWLVLETDAPDMTPDRYRGNPNRPAWMVETLMAVARIKGLSTGEVAHSSREVSLRVLPRIAMR